MVHRTRETYNENHWTREYSGSYNVPPRPNQNHALIGPRRLGRRSDGAKLLRERLRRRLVCGTVVQRTCLNCLEHFRCYLCKPFRQRVLRLLKDEDPFAEVL